MWLILTAVMALGPADALSPAIDTETMELVLRLGSTEDVEVEKMLEAKGPAAVAAMSWAFRSAGIAGVERIAAVEVKGCPAVRMHLSTQPTSTPGIAAGKVLIRRARSDAALLRALAGSRHVAERLLAIIASWDDAAAMQETVELAGTPARWTDAETRFVRGLGSCALFKLKTGMSIHDRQRLASMMQALGGKSINLAKCNDGAEAARLAEMTGAPVVVRGWSSGGTTGGAVETTINVDVGTDAQVRATPRCAYALYGFLVKKTGQRAAGLLTNIVKAVDNGVYPENPNIARLALATLKADIDAIQKEERVDALRVLMKHGFLTELLPTIDIHVREHDIDFIEAGLRANDPLAKKHLIARLTCPSVWDGVRLLPLLDDKKYAADEASRIAATCPQAEGDAFIALLVLKDPRWKDHFDAALDAPFLRQDLPKVLLENWSPELKARLEATIAKDSYMRSMIDEVLKKAGP